MKTLFEDELTTDLVSQDLDLNKLQDPLFQYESAAFLNLYKLFSTQSSVQNKNIVGISYDGIVYEGLNSKREKSFKVAYEMFCVKNLRKFTYEVLKPIMKTYILKKGVDKFPKSSQDRSFILGKNVYGHTHGRDHILVGIVESLCENLLRDENGNKLKLEFIYE
jgi:hypothetical protein